MSPILPADSVALCREMHKQVGLMELPRESGMSWPLMGVLKVLK